MASTVVKPAGIPVFAPHDDPNGDCVLRRLVASEPHRMGLPWPEGFAGGIAHRLDVSTSGAVLVADTIEELHQLRGWFRERRLRKRYVMLAGRDVKWDHNFCDRAVGHARRRRGRMVVQRGSNTPHRGRWYAAETSFTRWRGDLWRVEITTGVMHQIRVHAAFLGLPLLGDRLYGGGPTPGWAPEGVAFFLHHEGLEGPGGLATAPVPMPVWTETSS